MSQRVDLNFVKELKKYGAINTEACFNCGNCTAICPLTSDKHPFPRDMIRYAQLGLKDRILASSDPWQCYYCGQCTETCPRGAEPAETMMAIRRWVTAQYDRSGEGARLYLSGKAVLLVVARYVVLTLLLLVIYHVLTGGVEHRHRSRRPESIRARRTGLGARAAPLRLPQLPAGAEHAGDAPADHEASRLLPCRSRSMHRSSRPSSSISSPSGAGAPAASRFSSGVGAITCC